MKHFILLLFYLEGRMLSFLLANTVFSDLKNKNLTDIEQMVKKIKQTREKQSNISKKAIESEANRVVKSSKASDPCEGAQPIDFEIGRYNIIPLQQGQYACVNFTPTNSYYYYGFIAFGEGLKFEGYDENLNYQDTSEEAYASTYPITRVTATVNTAITYIVTGFIRSFSDFFDHNISYHVKICNCPTKKRRR